MNECIRHTSAIINDKSCPMDHVVCFVLDGGSRGVRGGSRGVFCLRGWITWCVLCERVDHVVCFV